jgi:hypothetical protein
MKGESLLSRADSVRIKLIESEVGLGGRLTMYENC